MWEWTEPRTVTNARICSRLSRTVSLGLKSSATRTDGSPGFAEIQDTDGGALDGDPEFDRAVGPMQFIPETWHRYGVDASGDGVADPHHIDDAAASAARLLCSGGRDLATAEGWTSAIRSYNQSDEYLRDVRDAAANYALNQPA